MAILERLRHQRQGVLGRIESAWYMFYDPHVMYNSIAIEAMTRSTIRPFVAIPNPFAKELAVVIPRDLSTEACDT